MLKLTRFDNIPDAARGASVALGNFDGLHAGHRAVIGQAREAAERLGAPLAVLMFSPPPRDFFQPDADPYLLMSIDRRMEILEDLGVDACFVIPFDASIATMTDVEFCQQVLHDGLGAKAIAVGFDFRFGKGRTGDANLLGVEGLRLGYEVLVAEEVGDEVGKVSSTAIRDELVAGDMEEASEMLGGYWRIEATVEPGEKRGRTIGFPTANMMTGRFQQPRHGVYAVWTRIKGERDWRMGAANFGRTPTTGLRDPLLETFILDYDGDVYGKVLETAFVAYLRTEDKFDTLDELVVQMGKDVDAARTILEKSGPPTG